MLSKKQLQNICMQNSRTSKRCRYLAQDDTDSTKYYCVKQSSKKDEIDVDLEEFIEESKKKGHDPYKQGIPLGDNCPGYPILKYIEQGYDK